MGIPSIEVENEVLRTLLEYVIHESLGDGRQFSHVLLSELQIRG